MWWIWQMQDPETRIDAWVTLGSMPPMPGMPGMKKHRRQSTPDNATIDLEWLAPPIKLTDANDQLGGNGGAYCYIYV